MTMAKIAISLPREILEQAQRAVRRGRAPTMSAYATAALQEKAMADGLEDLLAQMLAETGGPLTRQERAAARRALSGSRPQKRRAR